MFQRIEMLQTIGTPKGGYLAGKVYLVQSSIARAWCDNGLARTTSRLPAAFEQLMARLDIGGGQRCLFVPFVGEFGHQVMTHIRLVHFHKAAEKIVCCRRGDEVLYPSANQYVTDWCDPVRDQYRIGTMRGRQLDWPQLTQRFPDCIQVSGADLTPEQELFCIESGRRILFLPRRRGLRVDVVLGVRTRKFCQERNWTHWQQLANSLTTAGHTFAVIGHKSTSFDLTGQACHSGDLDTDAAIELLQNCRLYIGTDSGNSHLAATVGANMLVFREEKGGSRDLTERMREVNPQPIQVLRRVWDRPQTVIAAALNYLKRQSSPKYQ